MSAFETFAYLGSIVMDRVKRVIDELNKPS